MVTHRSILKPTLLIPNCAQCAMHHTVHATLHGVHFASLGDELHQQPLLLFLRLAPARIKVGMMYTCLALPQLSMFQANSQITTCHMHQFWASNAACRTRYSQRSMQAVLGQGLLHTAQPRSQNSTSSQVAPEAAAWPALFLVSH